jgi:hypothetical protein
VRPNKDTIAQGHVSLPHPNISVLGMVGQPARPLYAAPNQNPLLTVPFLISAVARSVQWARSASSRSPTFAIVTAGCTEPLQQRHKVMMRMMMLLLLLLMMMMIMMKKKKKWMVMVMMMMMIIILSLYLMMMMMMTLRPLPAPADPFEQLHGVGVEPPQRVHRHRQARTRRGL